MGRRSLSVCALSVLWVATGGCATLFAKGPDTVHVSSRPEGAVVLLDGIPVGETPARVEVPRDSDGVITIELEGHDVTTVDLEKVVNGMTFLNIAWGPIVPMVVVAFVVDAASGNIGKYPESNVHIDLRPRHGY